MKVLIAPDKFKGSRTAAQAARAIRRGLERSLPGVRCRELPIADGGEGTAEALAGADGGEWVVAPARDPLGHPIQTGYAWLPGGAAVIDMSAASGLWRVAAAARDPWRSSTFGTGELMRHARRRGARTIVVGLGGSATNDGGAGMAAALGWRFLDRCGADLEPLPCRLAEVAGIVPPEEAPVAVTGACDVGNPLLGPRGATRTYGPQKGIAASMLPLFEAGLRRLADVVADRGGGDFRDVPGAGAAGGLGFSLLAFCRAELRPGFELVAGAARLHEAVADCDLVITGEGRLDGQTLEGKGPAGVARLARRLGKPVYAFGGQTSEDPGLQRLFDGVFALQTPAMPLETALREAAGLLESRVAAVFGEFL